MAVNRYWIRRWFFVGFGYRSFQELDKGRSGIGLVFWIGSGLSVGIGGLQLVLDPNHSFINTNILRCAWLHKRQSTLNGYKNYGVDERGNYEREGGLK